RDRQRLQERGPLRVRRASLDPGERTRSRHAAPPLRDRLTTPAGEPRTGTADHGAAGPRGVRSRRPALPALWHPHPTASPRAGGADTEIERIVGEIKTAEEHLAELAAS